MFLKVKPSKKKNFYLNKSLSKIQPKNKQKMNKKNKIF